MSFDQLGIKVDADNRFAMGRGGRQAQPGVATGQSVLAWRLGYAEVFYTLYRSRSCGIFT
jgi:hypothetical protein